MKHTRQKEDAPTLASLDGNDIPMNNPTKPNEVNGVELLWAWELMGILKSSWSMREDPNVVFL